MTDQKAWQNYSAAQLLLRLGPRSKPETSPWILWFQGRICRQVATSVHAKPWMLIFLVQSDFEELTCLAEAATLQASSRSCCCPDLPAKEAGPKSGEAPLLASRIIKLWILSSATYSIFSTIYVFLTFPSVTLGDRQTTSYSEPASGGEHELCSIQADEFNGTAAVPINAQIRLTWHAKLQDIETHKFKYIVMDNGIYFRIYPSIHPSIHPSLTPWSSAFWKQL